MVRGHQEAILGRKVHPTGFRLGIVKDWDSKWFAEGTEYGRSVGQDAAIRDTIHNELSRAGVSRVEIQRLPKQITVTIVAAKPGLIIGRMGATVNGLKSTLEKITDSAGRGLKLNVVEVERPELDAHVVAEDMVEQLERRVAQKRAMRQAIGRAMRAGAEGIRISCGGRLSGSEMARREWMREDRVPLHTLRADIDYARDEALTTRGRIGVKVWIYRGDVYGAVGESAVSSQGV